MRRILGLVVVIAMTAGAGPAMASEAAQPSVRDEAERLLDQAAAELWRLGARLGQRMGRGPMLGPAGPDGMTGLEGPASAAERPLVSLILRHRAELALTPDQVSRLEALRGDFAREAIRRDADLRIAELDLSALLDQDPPDMAKVEAKVREIAQIRADLRLARIRTIQAGKAVLSPEQQARLPELLSGGALGARRPAGPGPRP